MQSARRQWLRCCSAGSIAGWQGNCNMKQNNNIGVAVIGAGRIGTLRARLAAKHPSVRFLAISDRDPARAQGARRAGRRRLPLRQQRRGDRPSGSHRGDRLDARAEHTAPVLQGARARQAGAGREADRALARGRRRDPRRRCAQTRAICASATAAATRNASCAPRSRCCTAASARSSAAPRASTIRARRPSRSSSAIRTRRRCSTCSPTTST